MVTLVETYNELIRMADTGASQETLRNWVRGEGSEDAEKNAEATMTMLNIDPDHVDEFVAKVLPELIDQTAAMLFERYQSGRGLNMDVFAETMAGMGLLTGLQVGVLYAYNRQENKDD